MEKRKGIIQGGLLYGSIKAAFFIIACLTLWLLGQNAILASQKLDFLLSAAFAFMMLKVYKEQWNGGLLHFWEGMSLGGVYALVTSLISASFMYLFAAHISPDTFAAYLEIGVEEIMFKKEEYIEANGEQRFQELLDSTKNATASIMWADTFTRHLFVALMGTSFISIFMRKTESR